MIYLGFTRYLDKDCFSCALLPTIAIQKMPPEMAQEYVGSDYKYSIAVAFLFWQGIICFRRYTPMERKQHLNAKFGKLGGG